MKFNEKFFVNSILLILFLLFLIPTFSFPSKTKLVPLVIGVPALFILVVVYISDIIMRGTEIKESEKERKFSQALEFKKEIDILLWIIGFVGITYFFGFNISIPLFIFTINKFKFSHSISKSLLSALGVWAFFYVSFDVLLNISFNCGILF